MKRLCSIPLILALLFPVLLKGWIIGSFLIHQQEIALTQCENRDKPEMGCEGKCQMVKELNHTDKHSQSAPLQELSRIKEVITLYSQESVPTGLFLPVARINHPDLIQLPRPAPYIGVPVPPPLQAA